MIRISPAELPRSAARALKGYQARVDSEPDFGKRVALAATEFGKRNRASNPAFRKVRETLTSMCSGARRCMYCEDSAADEVEHHRPKNLYPEHVFDWQNFLYACGPCNGPKNNRFAVWASDGSIIDITRTRNELVRPPAKGAPLLLHPRIENPLDFLMLDIIGDTFLFVPSASEGSVDYLRASYTLELLGLNSRDYLSRARREACGSYRARLSEYVQWRDGGASETALNRAADAIRRMQHPTVWFEMCRQHGRIPDLKRLFESAPEALTW